MNSPVQQGLSGKFYLFLGVSLIVVFINQYFFEQTPRPVYDSIRYIRYAVNIEEHRVFGLGEDASGGIQPGNENTPLYPFIISLASGMDSDLKSSLACLATSANVDTCKLALTKFAYLQCVFVVLSLCSIWLTALLLGRSLPLAWTAALVAYMSGELQYYANRFMTESLVILLFCTFILTLVLVIKTAKRRWHMAAALILGLLTLTRPEYHYLFMLFLLLYFFYCLRKRKRVLWQTLMLILISYYAVVGSWQMRNYYHFDNASLTGNYGGIILAYRAAYNRMSWQEWGVAFIYWFPDVGDSIAARLFDRQYYEKLGFDAGSYYSATSSEILKRVDEATTTPEEALGYLLKNEIGANLFKHSMVSIPLFWRGVFIAKYWGVVGLGCLLALSCRYREPAVSTLFILSLPAWFLVALHAFISVNIPRYNLVLLPIYAIAIAFVLLSLKERFLKRMKPGLPVPAK